MQSKKLQNLKKSFFGYIKRIFFDQTLQSTSFQNPRECYSQTKILVLYIGFIWTCQKLNMKAVRTFVWIYQKLHVRLLDMLCRFVKSRRIYSKVHEDLTTVTFGHVIS